MAAAQEGLRTEERSRVPEKVVHWLIFGVIMTLVPFMAVLLDDIDRGVPPTLVALFGRGELLIVAAIIAAGGIGELFGRDVSENRRIPKLVILGLCVLALVVTSLWFADVTSLTISTHPPRPEVVTTGSVGLFLATVAATTSGLLLSEG